MTSWMLFSKMMTTDAASWGPFIAVWSQLLDNACNLPTPLTKLTRCTQLAYQLLEGNCPDDNAFILKIIEFLEECNDRIEMLAATNFNEKLSILHLSEQLE